MSISLRRATKEDRDFIFQTKKIVLKDYVEQIWGWDERSQNEMFNEDFTPEKIRIILLNGTDIGIINSEKDKKYLRLNQLYILPEYQRKGIGTYCMNILQREASEFNLSIRLQTFKINTPARLFYDKLGFRITEETETHIKYEK